MNEEQSKKFTEDQVEAAKLARDILGKELDETDHNYDSLAFAFRLAELTGENSVSTIMENAKKFKIYLKKK